MSELQNLHDLAKYHNDVCDALRAFMKPAATVGDSPFIAFTAAEIALFLNTRIEETELRSSLAILLCVEGSLRIDSQLRRRRRLKDPLSRSFRKLHKTAKRRLRLEDILDLWALQHTSMKGVVRELRAALIFRHWLAHGRYWVRPSHTRLDYQDIYNLGLAVFQNFPLEHI
jgi:hypothetical protein